MDTPWILATITLTLASSLSAQTIPQIERKALIAIYEATDGAHWKNRSGWLGPEGTECTWEGVSCDDTSVTRLHLYGNGLKGEIPSDAVALTHLESVWLWDNSLEDVPKEWLAREDEGQLDLRLWGNPIRDRVTEISVETLNASLLCSHSMLRLTETGATLASQKCRNKSLDDRSTYCEVKRTHFLDLRRLARFLEKQGFGSLKPLYSVNQTHATDTFVRVTRNGQQRTVEQYGYTAPIQFLGITNAIRGAVDESEWVTVSSKRADFCIQFFEGESTIYAGATFVVELPAGITASELPPSGDAAKGTFHSEYAFTRNGNGLLHASEIFEPHESDMRATKSMTATTLNGFPSWERMMKQGKNRSREVLVRLNDSLVHFWYDNLPESEALFADQIISSIEAHRPN